MSNSTAEELESALGVLDALHGEALDKAMEKSAHPPSIRPRIDANARSVERS